ncbi:hypothetical protein AY599_04245 [Leptolyngbya valderiana BDU 20041]|nr:hypothetical protein AY599_04245 [Leptolyngbya valderiana BDU 20041]
MTFDLLAEQRSPDTSQKLLLHGVSWEKYEAFLELLGDDFPSLRLKYLDGTLQFVSPSRNHEFIKRNIARLLDAYLEETRTPFFGLGSTTFRRKVKSRGIEPDECYCFGEEKSRPDLAIEVVFTSGGIDSLAIYEGLEVPEVWFWENGRFTIYCLGEKGYVECERSQQLPGLDIVLLSQYVTAENPLDAVIEFRRKI